MVKRSLFGTSGIRGDAQKFLTNEFCFDIAVVFAKFLDHHQQTGPIAVGMDPRQSSPKILKVVLQGLAHAGRPILDQAVCPVPAINYLLKVSPVVASVMVTGSHIATELNGIKFFAFEEEILKKHEKEITELYYQLRNKVGYRQEEISVKKDQSAIEEYEEMLVKLADPYPRWKVVLDPGNGAQSDLMPRLISRLGLKDITINDELQGEFISRDTETEGVIKELQQKVVKEKADLGIAFDGDGDRVVFVDEKGQFIPGDYTGALIAKSSDVNKIITPINTSQVVEHLGKPVVRTKVGSPYVVAAMKKHQITFGFEANGGGISSKIMMSRDGGSSMIKVLNLLAKHGGSLSTLIATLPRFHLYRLKVDCPRKLNGLIIREAKKEFKGKTEEIDGLKIWLDETTWILFRPSSNAPEFRVFAEAKTKQKAVRLGQAGIKLVRTVIKKANQK